MEIGRTNRFIKRYKRLPGHIQKRADKQIAFLGVNFFHPSLNTRRLRAYLDWWEFRVTKNYRMAGKKINGKIILHTVGPHDEGLGKK